VMLLVVALLAVAPPWTDANRWPSHLSSRQTRTARSVANRVRTASDRQAARARPRTYAHAARHAPRARSYDGLHLDFESDRDNQGESVYVASRSNINADFGHPVRLPEVYVTMTTAVYPFVTDDNFTMYDNTPSAGLSPVTRGAF